MSWNVRTSLQEEGALLVQWLNHPDVLQWFPLSGLREIEDAVRLWMSYIPSKAALTATYEGKVVAMAVLYLHPCQALSHQALFALIVEESYRGQGMGRKMLEEVIRVARVEFHIALLHLEVYRGNPAIELYEKMGFQTYGFHPRFIKMKEGKYLDKILMQKVLPRGGS